MVFPSRSDKNVIVLKKNHSPGPYGVRHAGGTADVPYCTELSSDNKKISFSKRLNPVVPKGDPLVLLKLKEFTQTYLRENFVPLPYMEPSKEMFESWLDHCKHYNTQRKDKLRRCFRQLCSRDFKLRYNEYYGECFVKREFYPEPKCLRFINSRADIFKALMGPFIHTIEKQVYKDKHFVKGIRIDKLPETLVQLKKWDYILETDYTSFESSFSWEYMQSVELPFFKYFFKNNPFLMHIINTAYHDKGGERVQKMFSKEFDLRLTGCRLSGELWTSLSNGFANLMNMLFLCGQKKINCQGFIEGDDGLFGMDKPALTKGDFANLGFTIKMEYVHQVQDTTFCGNTFSDQSLKLLVNPENIGRLFWSCTAKYLKSSRKVLDSLFKSKAASLYVTGRFTPIAGMLAYKMLRKYADVSLLENQGYWRNEIYGIFRELECVRPVINYHDRCLYHAKFGIPISDQLLLEKYIENIPDNDDIYIPYCFMGNSYVGGLHY